MYYLIYKITNLINGKVYVGSHKTANITDSYMGSGKYLLSAQNKYGIHNFKKDILYVFDNPTDMYHKEAEIVDENFLMEENTYNLKKGGMGGFDYINQNGKNLYGNNGKTSNVKDDLARGRQTQKKRKIENPEYARRINQKISNTLKGHPGSFKDKQHTTETKRIIGEKSSIHQKGNKNSQFGTCWVFDEDEVNKKIKKENLDSYLSAGWIKGRRIKT